MIRGFRVGRGDGVEGRFTFAEGEGGSGWVMWRPG